MKYRTMINLLATTASYGENAAKWGLDQVFWVALLAGIVGAAIAIVKKSWVGAVLSAVGVGLICYFIKNPTKLVDIGDTLAKIVGW